MTTVHAQTGIKLATKPAKTSLLGGHFIYKANNTPDAPTPSSANVVEWVDNDPTLWKHNVHIGSNGIKLRYGEITLSKWDTDSLIFYTPTTTNGVTTTAKAIELNSTNGIVLYKDGTNKGLQLSSTGLEIFGSSQSTADLTATSNGINIGNGSIIGADNTVTNYVPSSGFLYLSTKNYGSNLNIATFGSRSNWRLVIGPNFGVTDEGNVYLNGANIYGRIEALSGTIGGWTINLKSLSKGTIGSSNSAFLATSNLSGTVAGKTFSSSDITTTGWRLTVGSNFGVDNTGKLYAANANITGTIEANEGSIGGDNGWTISSQEIKSTDYNITQTGSIYLSTKDLTTATTINGQSRTDWRFTIGDKFGVTSDGYLYANGSFITDITASSLNIGPVVRYGTCTTAKAASDKEVNDVTGFSLTSGAMITVTFTNGNSSSTLTLNVNSTGAKLVRNYNGDTLQYDDYTLSTYVARTFVYNGTYWLLQDTEAIARSRGYSDARTYYHTYVTDIDSLQGITIKPWNGNTNISNPDSNTNFIRLNANGLEIFKEGVSVASYGSDVRIGKSTSSNTGNVYIDDDSIDIRKGSTVLSTFTANGASLGVNSILTTIQLCGGVGKISAANLTQMQQGMTILTNPDSNKGSYLQFDALAKDGSTSVFSSTVQLRNDKVSGTNQYKAYIDGSLDNYNTDDSLSFTVSPLGIDMDFGDASKNQAQLRISTPETSLFLGINSGGSHGIYSKTLGSWIIYGSESGYAFTQLSFAPHTNATSTSNGQYLGWSTHRWRVVYAANGTVQTSDRKHKNIIGGIDFAKDLIMRLKPVEYQWKDSDHRRIHMGFIAQDSAEVAKFLNKDLSFYEAQYLDGSDYRGEETDDENLMWSMKYDELIAPLIKVVQEQQAEIDELKQRIEALERR